MARLSIITICYNEVGRIQKTLDSVINQSFRDFDWIVIDGGSTDGTKEILQQHSENFKIFISEKDGGIYNAMNKAIALATGQYLFFLNAGDYFSGNDVLIQIFSHELHADFVYGNITIIGINCSQLLLMPPQITPEFLYRKTIPHQSTFTKKTLFEKAGSYDEKYQIVSDYEFILRGMHHYNATFQYVPVVFACYADDGVSSDTVKRKREKKIVHKHFYSFFQRLVLKNKIKTKLYSFTKIFSFN